MKYLQTKKKSDSLVTQREFRNAAKVMTELEQALAAHIPNWKDFDYHLNEVERTAARGIKKLWIQKSRQTGLADITNFLK